MGVFKEYFLSVNVIVVFKVYLFSFDLSAMFGRFHSSTINAIKQATQRALFQASHFLSRRQVIFALKT